ncbi:hypothetical protein SOX05_08785 [Pseudomonas putida]|nr:hypothetical protein [Pseudomonas putida]MDY4319357.1 hypothetical protein [Pseudomonas putida]MDY4352742.1 hypothetical protein [Pseudomonas putida]
MTRIKDHLNVTLIAVKYVSLFLALVTLSMIVGDQIKGLTLAQTLATQSDSLIAIFSSSVITGLLFDLFIFIGSKMDGCQEKLEKKVEILTKELEVEIKRLEEEIKKEQPTEDSHGRK